MTIRRIDPDEAMTYTVDVVSRLLVERYPQRPQGDEMWWAALALLPELHARGVHAEWTPDRSGVQFSAFQPLSAVKEFWGYIGSDEEFEAFLLDIDPSTPIGLFTIHIDGVPTRCVEPFVREVD